MTERTPPDIPLLLRCLMQHRIDFVLAGSVAVHAWGVDVGTPGDLDIVPELSPQNLRRLADALLDLGAESWPITGRWREDPDGEVRWEEYPRDHPLRGTTIDDPDPEDVLTFDSLFRTRLGELDIVPRIAGAYEDLSSRAGSLTVHGVPDVRVVSVEDLLAHLTVPRRAKDAGRVRILREVQRRWPPSWCAEPGDGEH